MTQSQAEDILADGIARLTVVAITAEREACAALADAAADECRRRGLHDDRAAAQELALRRVAEQIRARR